MKVQNDSSVEVVPAVELNRHLYFKADGHHIYDKDMRTLGRAEAVQPGETKEVQIPFKIPDALPTTDGRYIDCKYVIDILVSAQPLSMQL